MISVDDAFGILDAGRLDLSEENVPLALALGRTLARDLNARHSVPAHASSSMDGYAVRSADLPNGAATLRVIGEAPAGEPFAGKLAAGEAVRIFTGAHVPHGADRVVIQENAERAGDHVTLSGGRSPNLHIRAEGVDFSVGETLIQSGARIGPAEIAIAAAADHAALEVMRKPRVAIIANGNELRLPGSPARDGSVVASNAYGLSALVTHWGGEPDDRGIVADDVDAICKAVEQCFDADIIVPVGGASVGNYDYMRAAFERLGLESQIAKIAVKPGKPTWSGLLGNQRILGLPGNPASAYVCAHLFLRLLMSGAGVHDWRKVTLAHDIKAEGPREAFLRARRVRGKPGSVELLPNQDSSLLKPFLTADCLIRRPGGAPAAKAGDTVTALQLQN